MPITFVPKPGGVLMCDFGPHPNDVVAPGVMHGPLAVLPEIHKNRPAVVVAAPSVGLAIMVPLSTEAPRDVRAYHYCIPAKKYQFLDQSVDSWAKADLIEAVSYKRLDRCRVAGAYKITWLNPDDFQAILACVKNALNL